MKEVPLEGHHVTTAYVGVRRRERPGTLAREHAVDRVVLNVHDLNLAAVQERVAPFIQDFTRVRVQVKKHLAAIHAVTFVDFFQPPGAEAESAKTLVVLLLGHHGPGLARKRKKEIVAVQIAAQLHQRHEIRFRIIEIQIGISGRRQPWGLQQAHCHDRLRLLEGADSVWP